MIDKQTKVLLIAVVCTVAIVSFSFASLLGYGPLGSSSEAYQWTPQVGGTYAEIDTYNSVFPTTASIGESIEISTSCINVGDTPGGIYFKLVKNPNTASETELNSDYDVAGPGVRTTWVTYATFDETTALGVKTWGQSESEPAWGTSLKTYQWTITVTGEVIARLDITQSTLNNGPFSPNQILTSGELATINVYNDGTQSGDINLLLVQYPGASNEEEIVRTFMWYIAPGQHFNWDIPEDYTITVPNTPGESWPLGIKVWGETEAEPDWGTAGGTSWSPPISGTPVPETDYTPIYIIALFASIIICVFGVVYYKYGRE